MNIRSVILPRRGRDFASAKRRGHFHPVDPAVVEKRQLVSLSKIWVDAVNDIPYYLELVKSGHAPSEIRSWKEFKQIPFLTRQILQDSPDAFIRISRKPNDYIKTAGSTGTPLRIGVDQCERDLMRLVKLAAWQHFGYTEKSRLFLIWGHSHLLGTGWKGKLNHIKRKLADQALGYRRVDAYKLDRAACASHAEALLKFKPLGVIGYASALDLFARYTTCYREKFRELGLRFILATSEPPPKPDTLSLLEDHFGCPVVQEYGGAEFGQVAFRTGSEPFEVYSDLNYVEAGDMGNSTADGHPLLLTSLYQRYVPLFRYAVNDCVLMPEYLDHGHVTSFSNIAGRINDMIYLDDDVSIHSVAIFHCIHQEPSVLNIQVLIDDSGIAIRLVSSAPHDPDVEGRIKLRLSQVHHLLGNARISYVEDLATNRAGKRRWFIDSRNKVS